ncbi:MAG: MFS transporter [Aquamicrobium sp.]|uniref:MFS transporter n=1 Tax=Aquamicrobium sp. TaxID=1872579 RepID=UPI00349E7C6E|nr:MFS transporter [Aquamicrobium sp.]
MAGLAALTLAYMLSQFYRAFLAVLAPVLAIDLGAAKTDLSMASGAWFAAFALSQFLVGIWLDRHGPKRTAGLLLGICGGGGAFLFAFATQPWMIVAAMALIGIGCAPVLMASMFIFAHTWSPARLAVLTSWLIGLGSLGNVIGASPLAAAAEAFGWRPVIAGLGVVTLLIAGAILFFVRDPEQAKGGGVSSGFSGYVELMRLKALWPVLPLVAMNYVPSGGIRGLWAGPYLADVYGADALAIGQATLFMALAMSVGSFVYGPLDTFFRTRKWVAFAGNALLCAALVLLALDPAPGIGISTTLLVVIGLSGASFGLLMAHGRAFCPPHLTGRGITLLNFFSIGAVGLMQFASGAVVSTATVPGDPAAAYAALYWFYAAALALSLVIYLCARDARPEHRG